MISFIIFVVFGYLTGSISSAVIVSQLFSLPDPRAEGSKNPGATNVLRLAGKRFASLVMIIDLLKGFLPVFIAKMFHLSPTVLSYTALFAVFGHMYPLFFEFKGGKGVATAIGAYFGLNFALGGLITVTWLVVAKLSFYSSLASIASLSIAPLYFLLLFGDVKTFPPLFFIALFVLYKHHANISRLIAGKEHKIKFRKNVIDELIPDPAPQTGHEIAVESSKDSKKAQKNKVKS